jgi:HSP20 family protein
MLIRRFRPLTEWDWKSPFEELERMRKEMDRLFESITGSLLGEGYSGVYPPVNVTEDRDNFYVRAELPGLKSEDIEISATSDSLTISGERKAMAHEEEVKYHRRERETGRFSRVITLPEQFIPDKVEATLSDGILSITLPKTEAVKPKQIEIKS